MRDKVIILGAVVVLGFGFALWRMTRDISSVEAEPEPPRQTKPAEVVRPEVTAVAPEASKPIQPAVRSAPVLPTAPRQPASPGSSGTPALEVGTIVAPDPPQKVKEYEIKHQLIKQIDALDGAVSDCVAKTTRTGVKPTGASALTLKIERTKTGTAIVVDVAVEPIDTTIKDTALNQCLRDTGRKIQLELPEGITEVTATHQVNLDGGSVTGHDLTAFDFKPGGRPPEPPPSPPKP